jgi:putative addiction module component (TIGR02574 family)
MGAKCRLFHLLETLGAGLRPGDIIWGMMQDAQELLKKALALPDRERADLAGGLIDSLDDNVDENAQAAWQEEIVRRLEDVQSGKVKTTSWDEVRQKGRRCCSVIVKPMAGKALEFHPEAEQEYLDAFSVVPRTKRGCGDQL